MDGAKRMAEGLLLSIEGEHGDTNLEQQQKLEAILDQYVEVFKEPTGLPPKRGKEHAINLFGGQGHVNVSSYHYPHHHKNEIEKQVIIQHNRNAFSNPIILVKKKKNVGPQIELSSSTNQNGDVHKTQFQTHDRHYEYLAMPFGLCPLPLKL
ncbi:hypothetical protein CR513_30731, partial [Mucuna pruriens]